ncbi:hypothetical protein HA466_0312860 [Hirschfeldia incana]|nr:hypothetical protein HA466_0312860 [Hirschfeldia incana]
MRIIALLPGISFCLKDGPLRRFRGETLLILISNHLYWFRSLVSVKTYLSNAGNGTAASVSKQRRTHVVKKNHRSATVSKVHSKQVPRLSIWNGTRFETVVIDPQPPKTVKWVFNGPEGNKFSAHVNGSDVSTSVKQTWSETFVSLIQDRY